MERLELGDAATCRVCATELALGTEAWWDATSRQAACVSCDAGGTGADGADSATHNGTEDFDAEWGKGVDSHRAKVALDAKHREDEIRTKHPHLGGLILQLTERFRSERPSL